MILTDDEIRKAAEFAAEQMWPESGYVGWTEDDAVFHRKFIEACFEKLRGGVEVPEPMGYLCDWGNDSYGLTHQTVYYGEPGSPIEDDWNCHPTVHKNTQLFTRDQLLRYGAAQRLAGRERETCTWAEQDDKDMPGTYASSCGEMWSFIDGGVKENRVTYCHHCGGKVVPASPQEQT